jgi:hypothetical protein
MVIDPQIQLKLIELADTKAEYISRSKSLAQEEELNAYLEQFKKIYGELVEAVKPKPAS